MRCKVVDHRCSPWPCWPPLRGRRSRLGGEFMPTLNEGTCSTCRRRCPAMSVTKAAELLQTQDQIIKSFPEVASVFGKAGRAETATDPAPVEMFETVINLKPETEWRAGHDDRQAHRRAGQGAADSRRVERLDDADQGAHRHAGDRHPHARSASRSSARTSTRSSAWPRRSRRWSRTCPGRPAPSPSGSPAATTSTSSPTAQALARYGLTVGDLQDVIAHRARRRDGDDDRRGPRALRRQRALPARAARRSAADRRQRAGADDGRRDGAARASWPSIRIAKGAPAIRTENALLSAYIYVDIRDRDIGGYVADARKAVAEQVKFPPGYYIAWSGQFEYMERALEQLKIVVPVTLLLIFLLLYLNFRRLDRDLDRHAVGALRAGRRHLADVAGWATTCRSPWPSASSRWPAWRPRPAW